MPNPAKVAAVSELQNLFESNDSFFVTDYQGLNVAQMTDLRRMLRENKVKFLIAKNTLLRLAATNAGFEGINEHLAGPTAIAFTQEDPAVAAKILHDCYKDHELPRMKVFVLDQQQYEATSIKRLAELPPRDALLSGVVASVEAPFTELIGSLDGFFRELVGTIEALADARKSAS